MLKGPKEIVLSKISTILDTANLNSNANQLDTECSLNSGILGLTLTIIYCKFIVVAVVTFFNIGEHQRNIDGREGIGSNNLPST